MVSLTHLWLPILLAAVLVFIVSSLVHMVLKYHNSDYHALPNEAAARAAMPGAEVAPGMYVIPHCPDMKDMGSEAMQAKYAEGPVAMLLVRARGPMAMGKFLGQWFVLTVVVAFATAYLASRTLPAGTPYLQVHRVTGTITFLAYATGSCVNAIWMGYPWRAAVKDGFDALLFGFVTGGAFGWLWPHA
jgi:hypothetical protein